MVRPCAKDRLPAVVRLPSVTVPLPAPPAAMAGGAAGGGGGGGVVGGGGDGGGGEGAATDSKPTVGGVALMTETPSAAVRVLGVALTSVACAAEAALAVGRITRASIRTLAGATVMAMSTASGKSVSMLDLKPARSKVLTSPATVKLVRITCW